MIKNIIFDVGKVLVTFEPEQHLKNLGYDKTTQQAIMQAMFSHPLWNENDRGVMTDEELLTAFIANAPEYEKEVREAFAKIEGTIELLPHTMEWVKDLKNRGYHLYILSNYGEYTYKQTEHKLEFLPYMDGTIFSYKYKIIKAEKEIYQLLLDKFHLKAEECVFIDDKLENVKAAQRAGMKAVQFLNYEQVIEALKNEGISKV